MQLQCLAQNTAFLNGIFSWRIVNSNHSMNSVMTKLQLLLGQMVLGGDSKLSTLDFSNALGLEHDEQQDPNEFARLLFERMDESFQQCDNGGDLANLLQRIFHGLTTYETICMTCGNSSERSEGFMDLNLPIIKRPKETKTSTSTIKEAFAKGKGVDTDVQYCLDQYTCAELLEGDNQYFCSTCKCKQDAKRVMKLTELPPVLNVQLSRYVFDRTQYVKKKLTDKVLLPTTLYVEKSGGSKIKYLLCAVMRHQGTSAYRGHYVAETMNWMTGQWFEFNDETVKLLPEGPLCSYDPPSNTTATPLLSRTVTKRTTTSRETRKRSRQHFLEARMRTICITSMKTSWQRMLQMHYCEGVDSVLVTKATMMAKRAEMMSWAMLQSKEKPSMPFCQSKLYFSCTYLLCIIV
jgi:ubiquitin carboxyl-terminal hydrolase 48